MIVLVRGGVEKIGYVKTLDSSKMVTVAPIQLLNTRSMHMQTPHSSQHITVGTHAKVAISSRRHRWCKHSLARARIGVPSSVRGWIKVASTTVHRSFNGNARLRSRTKLLGNLAAAPDWRAHSNCLTENLNPRLARLTLERVGRFECDLDSGTHRTRVRATRQEAADGEAAFGGEACLGILSCVRKNGV